MASSICLILSEIVLLLSPLTFDSSNNFLYDAKFKVQRLTMLFFCHIIQTSDHLLTLCNGGKLMLKMLDDLNVKFIYAATYTSLAIVDLVQIYMFN